MEDVYWPVGRFHFWGDWHKKGNDHGQCTIIFQRRSFTTVYGKNTVVHERKRSAFGLRISPYTATEIFDRNTGSCNTAKYGHIRRVNSMYTVVYGVRNDRPGLVLWMYHYSLIFQINRMYQFDQDLSTQKIILVKFCKPDLP